jgi:hypothetical protein
VQAIAAFRSAVEMQPRSAAVGRRLCHGASSFLPSADLDERVFFSSLAKLESSGQTLYLTQQEDGIL